MLYIESLPGKTKKFHTMFGSNTFKEVSYSLLLSWSKSPNIFIDLWQKELVPIEDLKKHEFSFKPKGGILADDFGLGKTLTGI
jgi:SNF2 family DNA or RNA helicase